MTTTIEIRKRKPYGTKIGGKSKATKAAPVSILPAEKPADQPQTLGAHQRAETAAHRLKVLKSKFTDARESAKAEAKKKGILPNGV